AQQMLDRLATDVIAQRPDLVIWESGTAEAVRGIEVDQYAAALLAGVDRLTGAGIEVVLMDMQFSRSTARIINFRPYVEAVLQVAGMRDLIVFPRYDVMRWWIENDRIDFDRLTPADTAKIADRVYDCLGWLMAESIGRALREPPR
ncbi:MAG: hypothetical protein HY057_02575, partial [Rhodospirillales bacterium]|nr:hypothetical protein [Rhodospirillales bacterium]